ncbi:condensation domain-containing protein [Streptomyces sp. BI20]|uniref:condensation domain-containing protein n=1 Tax=Streptomyces sp. BI20 TaxID=3403460 RepID=UPI003C756956
MPAPTGVEDALAALPEAKRELARRLLAARRPVPAAPAPRSGAGPVPAGGLQIRLWRRQPAHPAAATGSHALRLHGPLDADRLTAALAGVVATHEALRLRLRPPTAAHGPAAHARPLLEPVTGPGPVPLRVDLSALPPGPAAEAMALHLAESAAEALDPVTGRTIAFRLLRLAPDEHVLVLASHLAVFDGWSSGVFLADLATGYRAGPAAIPAPALQFPDHLDWQHRRLASPEGAAELAATRAAFAGDPPARLAPGGFERGHLPVRLAPEAVRAGFALGAAEGVTPFMTLLAGLAVTLARRTGRPRAVIGVPTAGRFSGPLEGAVGQFSTVVPLGIDLTGRPDARTLLRRARTAVAEALGRQRLPVDALWPDGTPPPYEVLFALHNYPEVPLDLPGITVGRLPGPPARHLELYSPDPAAALACVGLVERDGEISGTAEYNRRAGTAEEVRGLLTGIEEVLARAAADPTAPLYESS